MSKVVNIHGEPSKDIPRIKTDIGMLALAVNKLAGVLMESDDWLHEDYEGDFDESYREMEEIIDMTNAIIDESTK